MSEPRTTRGDRRAVPVDYYSPYNEYRVVYTRRNRTLPETDAQYARLYAQLTRLPEEDRRRAFNRLQRAYTRVSGALAATGRDPEWANFIYNARRNRR